MKRISPSRNYEVLSAVRTFLLVLGSYYLFAGLVMAQTPATLTRIAPQKLYLQEEKPLTLTYVGNPASVYSLTSGMAKPLSLASGDFDGDGVEDLIAGYALPKGGLLVVHRGNLDAFAPQSQKTMQAIGQEQFPSPFLPQANVVELLEAPDFLATGSFDTAGYLGLVVGARGSHTIYFLPGNGRGGFLAPQTISLSGSLTALGAAHFDPTTMQSDVLAGISTDTGNELVVLESQSSGWGPVATTSLSGTATSFAFGDLDRNGFPSAAVVAGGEVFILHGAAVHSARTGEGPSILLAERLALPVSAVSATIGSFLPDRAQKLQIAVLAADGSTQIVTRTNLDTRPWSLAEMIARRRAQIERKTDPYAVSLDPNEGWQVAESLPAVVAASGSGQTPVLLRTRISDRATDDLMLLDTRIPGVHVFAHESMAAPAASSLASNQIPPPVHLSLPMTSSQIPVAGLSMRVNIDGRAGVVLLKSGQVAPQVMMPLPDPTFFVNKFTDPVPGSTSTTCNNTSFADVSSSCSLREAILKANADVGTDTIMVPAGTITIQQPRVAGNYTGRTGTFEITNSMNIVGSVDGTGKPASILQAGTTASNGIDKVMSINQDISAFTNATASLSNLVFQFGLNRGSLGVTDGFGGAFDFDTGTSGTAGLTVTNCLITNNSTTDGDGGGVALFNSNSGPGVATFTNSIIQNNSPQESSSGGSGLGGGIFIGFPASAVLNNTQVINNTATQAVGSLGQGGGIYMFGSAGTSTLLTLHGSTISGNHAAGPGGGIATLAGLLIDAASGLTAINNNISGGNGGGIWFNGSTGLTATLSKVTITGNTATGHGGGIRVDSDTTGNVFNMTFSRLAGNSATGGGSNLSNLNGTVNAPSGSGANWWGTNSPASTIELVGTGTNSTDPFIVLSNTASPGTIAVGATSTVTASFLQDNHANPLSAANLGVLIGLPASGSIFPDIPVHGTLSSVQTQIQGNGQATEIFTATTAGTETVHAAVDLASVAATITVSKSDTTTAVISSVNPAAFGQSVTFTATVSPVAPATGTPTGTVTFLDGGSPIGTGTLGGGVATFVTSALAVGNHTITTSYGGDSSFNGSTGSLTGNPQVVNKTSTATALTSSANPSVLGQSVTFTATVSPVAPGAGTATGTVTFLDGGSPIGTGTLSGGVATFVTAALAVGNHTITTSYGGDGNFNGSTGSLTGNPQVVNKTSTTTTLTSSANPSVLGQSVTFTATVSPVAPGAGTATGTVTFLDGGSPIGTGTLSAGLATFTSSALAAGSHTITTSYGGDGNFNGSTGSLTGNPQVVNKANTTTIVTSSANPSVFGQSVTFTATVSAVAPGTGTPTGTVTFLDGGSPIGTGTLSEGVATFATSALSAGNHTITTSYGGDSSFNGSTGSLTGNPQVVNKANSTTAVTSTANPSVFGQSVTFRATVSAVAPGTGTPTGTVTFLDGGSPIGTGTLTGGVATFVTTALAAGNHTITTSYGGDGNFNGSTGSLIGNPQIVNKADSTTAVTSTANPSVFGQSVTFTATVSAVAPGTGTPTGTVTFLDGGSPIGTGTLTGGVATFVTSALAVGNHTMTTSYGGDGNFNGSTGSLTGNPQVVNKTSTATALTSSANPSVLGQSVTFTATVSPVAPGAGTATGTVTFLDGGSPIGTGTLSGGLATFTSSALSAGSHTITTSYGGNGNFNGSTGSLTGNPQVVNKAGSTTALTSSANPSVLGQSVTFTATVSPVAPGTGTPTGTVTFLDGGSPIGTGTLSEGVATFATSALSAGNHTITTSYGGDSSFNGSTGSLTGNPQVVNKANSTTAVTSTANPSVFGQSVTFRATVSAVAPGTGTPTGTVTFLDGGSPIGTGTLTGGVATFVTTALAAGNHTITTSYGGDGNFNGSTGSLTGNPQVVNKADSTTAVTSTANPSVFGQSVTFTATVSAVAPGTGTPTGTVTFLDGGSPIGTGTLTGGVATFVTSALAVGNHTITTSYGGDGNFNGSTGSLTGNPQVVNKAISMTAVTSNANPSVSGQSVTFTATVSPAAPGAGTATGTVTFLDGGSPIGTGTLSAGLATFTSLALAAGSHTITTSYGGDGNFNGSTGSLTGNPEVVNKADSTTALTSTVNPSVLGQSVTFRAAVTAVKPGRGIATGTVTFLDGGSPIGTRTLSEGLATFTTSALAIGDHTITTSYGGDANFNGSTGSLTGNPQVVNKAGSTTALTSSANPSVLGQSVTFTATVSPVAPGAGIPTGTVTFLDGGSPIGTGTLSEGVATFATSALSAGNHTITTSYGGDSSFNGSTGSLTGNPQVVNKANSTTAVTSSANPSVFGQSVTFTATISPVAPGAGTATGTVTFLDGGSPIGTGTLGGGLATFTSSALAVGSHTITTSYGGDGNFNGSTGSLTGNPQVVNKTDSATAVISSLNPSAFGQSMTFTATVSAVLPGTGTPTGTVTFLDGGSPIGTGTLSGGVATFVTSALASGNHTITTSHGGDGNFNGSTGSLTGNPQVVNKAGSTTALTSSANPSVLGQSVTFTATVSPVAPGAGIPTGTVAFLDGGSPIGTGTLSEGVATFTTSALAAGSHTITSSYGGDANFNGSTGSLSTNPQLVNKASTTTAATSSLNPSPLGQSVMFTATVSAVPPGAGTPTGTVTFLDGGSPIGTGTLSGGVATFSTSALVAGAHTITTSYGGDASFNTNTGSLTGNSQEVAAPPTATKAFVPGAIPPNGVSTLTITITNPAANAVALVGLAFTDNFPANLVVATPSGFTNTCGGSATATAGSASISLAGGAVPSLGSCAVTVNVTSSLAGTYLNSTGSINSTDGGTGTAASATLIVATPPNIAISFAAASIGLGGSTTLTFTITNPNESIALNGVAFSDSLPAGLTVSTPNGLTGTCGSGTITAASVSQSITLAGATIAASGACTFSVSVTGVVAGNQVNTTGNVSATNGGLGNTATASTTVLASDMTITKGHTGNFFQGEIDATYTLIASNLGPGPTLGTVTVADTLPNSLTATAIAGTGWTCILATVTCTRSDALAVGSSYASILVTVTAAVNAPASVTNVATVSGGGEVNTSNDTATDLTTITLPPDFTISLTPSPITVASGGVATYTILLTPQNNFFSNSIDLTVTGLPGKVSIAFNPLAVTPGAKPAMSTLTVTTLEGDPFVASGAKRGGTLSLASLWPLFGLLLTSFVFPKSSGKRNRWMLFVILLTCMGIGLAGCTGSETNFQNLGTTPGTYNLTITGTSGPLTHSASATLIVK